MSFIRKLINILLNIQVNPSISTQEYWEHRYARGGSSGKGSQGDLAKFKAEVINSFVKSRNIKSVIEFGCGDGNQLMLAEYPNYVGLDVSKIAIKLCQDRFRDDETKSFFLYDPYCFMDKHSIFCGTLALSLDVIYHLIEGRVFELHMRHLFSAADCFVIIYSSNFDGPLQGHLRHRKFSDWIETSKPNWKLLRRIPNRYPAVSSAEFFIYKGSI